MTSCQSDILPATVSSQEGIVMSNWGKVIFNEARNHYAVVGTWKGQRLYFSQYQSILGPVRCTSEAIAERLRLAINTDIEKGIFNPSRYKITRPLHLNQFAKNWLIDIESELSAATLHDYKNSLNRHILPVLKDTFLPDIGYTELKKLMRSINRSPKGKKNVMGCLHRLMVDAKKAGHISHMPDWPSFRGSNEIVLPPITYISLADQLKIIQAIPLPHRSIFLFMMATGCRPSEARAFRREDIFSDHIIFAVAFGRNDELKSVKQKKVQPFPLTEEIKEILEGVQKTAISQYVFINPDTDKPYTKNINRIWNRGCDEAGIKRIGLYPATRHSFACHMLNGGVDKGLVSRLLRHSDPRMIDRYAEYELMPLQKAIDGIRRLQCLHSVCSDFKEKST